ncbi:MAG: hypothetical protein AAFY57_09770 [Cyanobacteria bacterium J06642_2]
MSQMENVHVKVDTRNHQGFFVPESSYTLEGIENGWALICVDDAHCHYVDPDSLRLPKGKTLDL